MSANIPGNHGSFGFRNLRPKLQVAFSHLFCFRILRFWDWKIWMFPKTGVPLKSSMFIGFSSINHPFWGTRIFGNTYMDSNNPIIAALFDVQSQLTNKFWQNKLQRLFGRFTWCKLQVKRCHKERLRRWLGKCTSVRSRLKWWPKVSVWRLSGKVTSNGPLFDVKKKWHVKLWVASIIYKVTWSSRYIGVNSNLPTYKIRDRRSFWTFPAFLCNVSAFVSLSVAKRIEGLMNQHVSFYMVDFLVGNQEANIVFQALDVQMSAQKRDHDPFAHVKTHALTCGVLKRCKCMMT